MSNLNAMPSMFNTTDNPLDEFEELLEASPYEFQRINDNRLHFECTGKQGEYSVILEWNADMMAMKCSLIIGHTQKIARDILETAVITSNESAWHGFFTIDGVGNSVFKSLAHMADIHQDKMVFALEDVIDNAIAEADRFCISLALSNDNESQKLFPDNDWDVENLTLMFSDMKGSA
jgi:hypothetical protein